jgi:outer membrane protein TolC
MKYIVLISFSLILGKSVFSQRTFTAESFFSIVIKNHPLAKRANLKPRFGNFTLLKARGGFDPKLSNEIDQKYYNSSQYYSYLNAGLKVPTWFGVELKTGLEMNDGVYLSQEHNTPQNGLVYVGLSMNLGQGLFIDQRRAELFKAKIYQNSSLCEQRLQLNELVYEAGYAYWNWTLAYFSKEIMKESYLLASDRFEGVKQLAVLGDRPPIDSVEAKIQVQNRETLLRNYETDYYSTSFNLATYLWAENQIPLELDSLTSPIELTTIDQEKALLLSDYQIDTLVQNHPYLQLNDFKIKSLAIDNRLKKEQLKPTLNINYNLLNEPINSNPYNGLSINNYKWGLTFEMPLLLRKERGDLGLAQLKLQDEQLNYSSNKAYLTFKIKKAVNDYSNSINQLEIITRTLNDSKLLLEAEKQLFVSGESSLFLINARELAYIQARLKFIECIVKVQQSKLTYTFAIAGFY